MKKLLGISLVAMMAVTTANAEIASRAYVDQQDNDIDAKITTLNADASTSGSVANKIAAAIDQEYNASSTKAQSGTAVAEAIATVSGTAGSAIQSVKVNGTALTKDENNAVDVTVPTGALASKDKVAEADLDSALGAKVTSYDTHIADAGIHVTAAQKTEWSGKQDALTPAQVAAVDSGITSTLVGKIGTNESAITTLNGNDQTVGSVDYKIAQSQSTLNSAINQKADKATTLAGYNIADAYTKTETDTAAANAVKAGVSAEGSNGVTASATDGKVTVTGVAATTGAAGVVQLADEAAVTAGTAGRVVDAAQLKVVANTANNALTADSALNGAKLTAGTVPESALDTTTQNKIDGAVQAVASGATDGTIAVDGTDVAVTGLKALAYKDTVGTDEIDNASVTIAKLSAALPAECQASGAYDCVLKSASGVLGWEKITRASGEPRNGSSN